MLQAIDEIDQSYQLSDPWQYSESGDDARRRDELLGILPQRHYRAALDIGCGNGFVTQQLPAAHITGIDVSAGAVTWARVLCWQNAPPQRFTFQVGCILELDALAPQTFDLIVITGVLYPQYIGRSLAHIRAGVDALLQPGGTLVCCHIDAWTQARFPYQLVEECLYPYREYTHRLELYRK